VAGKCARPERGARSSSDDGLRYGISVSLFQLAHAYTIFARDGELIPVSFVRTARPVVGQPIISSATAREIRACSRRPPGAVAPRQGADHGLPVAGKTGTAYKPGGRSSERKFRASFVGFGRQQPRLIVAVMIDEPSNGRQLRRDVAAPVFSRVMEGSLRMLGIPTDAPMKPVELLRPARASRRVLDPANRRSPPVRALLRNVKRMRCTGRCVRKGSMTR